MKFQDTRLHTNQRRYVGFTLIELMVALVIGLALTLVITRMLANQEAVRRGVTSGNELAGNSAYASYSLERELAMAGAGFSQNIDANYGCLLRVSRSATQLLPATTNFPAPFATVPRNYVLAPLVVHAGLGANGSDIIAVAAGASGLSERGLAVTANSTTTGQLTLPNTLGIRPNDLVLVSQPSVGCMVQQVQAGFVASTATVPQPLLTFGGTYAADTIAGLALVQLSRGVATNASAFVSALGNPVGNPPRFQLLGLGTNGTLFSYDLLNINQTAPQALVEGIVDMRVRYGVSTPTNPAVGSWVRPTDPGFTAAALTAGTYAANQTLQNIVAVRVGLVMRSELIEKDSVSAGSLTLFSSLGAGMQHTFTLPTDGTRQRYRAVEFTVPLRNVRSSLPRLP